VPESPIRAAKLLPLPAAGVWRVSSWDEPFEPPPPPPPIGSAGPEEENAGRWDAPDGSFRVLYCSTEPEGAIGEKIAPFTQNPAAVAEIEGFFEEEPDPEWQDDFLAAGLTAEDVAGLAASLSWAPARADARVVDVWHASTLRVFARLLAPAIRRFGMTRLDRLTLLTDERAITRTVAGILHRAACDGHGEPRWASGLRFESRLPPGWECFALWEPVPVEAERMSSEPLTIDNPHLRSAAAQLGVVLYDVFD